MFRPNTSREVYLLSIEGINSIDTIIKETTRKQIKSPIFKRKPKYLEHFVR